MGEQISQPGSIHLRIIEVMKRFPEGISGGQIRQELEKAGLRPEDWTNLDRPNLFSSGMDTEPWPYKTGAAWVLRNK